MTDYTIDGKPVEPGLIAWDYDLELIRVIGPERFRNPNEDQWYECERIGTGGRKSFNGGRLWTKHPTTGQTALDAVIALERAQTDQNYR